MQESKLRAQSLDFAVSIINLVKELKSKHETIISNQVGRSGTSIGANIREIKYGYQSLSSFIEKEIEKDLWILNNTNVTGVEWHFYKSDVVIVLYGVRL